MDSLFGYYICLYYLLKNICATVNTKMGKIKGNALGATARLMILDVNIVSDIFLIMITVDKKVNKGITIIV